jgi:hypothetical protein
VGCNIANQPGKGFFAIPAQFAQDEAEGVSEVGIAADVDVGHQSVCAADCFWQRCEREFERNVGLGSDGLGEITVIVDAKADFEWAHEENSGPTREWRQAFATPRRVSEKMVEAGDNGRGEHLDSKIEHGDRSPRIVNRAVILSNVSA